MTRPFRFGFQTYWTSSAQDWAEQVRKAEDLGFSVFTLADHYIGPGAALDRARHPVQNIAAIPAMAAAAAASTTIRIGCKVLCVDYHHPVVLAKELATIDMLSGGRLEVGLGAGWVRDEYDAMGIPMDPPGVRIDRVEAVADLVRRSCAGESLDMRGPHVTAYDFAAVPVSPQAGGPPIMIGGGAPRILRMAGRVADIVSINFNNEAGVLGPGAAAATAEETARKVGWIAEGAGDRFDQVELEIPAYFTIVTEDPEPAAAAMAGMLRMEPAALRQHPHALIGPAGWIVDTLEQRRSDYGISYVSIASRPEAFAPVVAELAGK